MRTASLSILVLLGLAACSQASTVPSVVSPGAAPAGIASNAKRAKNIYIADDKHDRLLSYPATANGNVAPSVVIAGSKTALISPNSVGVNSSGTTMCTGDAQFPNLTDLVQFAPRARGNVAPVKTTKFQGRCDFVGVSSDGYMGAIRNGDWAVFVWAPGAKNPTAFSGTFTEFDRQLAFDAAHNVYLASYQTCMCVFKAGAQHFPKPIAKVAGAKTGIDRFLGVAVDNAGKMVWISGFSNSLKATVVAGYKLSNLGNVAPDVLIAGNKTQLFLVGGIAVDSAGYVYVNNGGSILVFAPGSNGNVAPVQIIKGPKVITNSTSLTVY